MKLYHVSKVPNLELIEPKISTHKKAYVYATPNLNFALLFGGAGHGDFDGFYGDKDKENGIPYFYEAYPNAFKNRFENEQCYVYQVDPTSFLENQTTFKGELVSEQPVKVVESFKIDNLYSYFQNLIKENKFVLKTYNSQNPEYVAVMRKHIKDRIVMFETYKNKNSKNYIFCQQHYADILKECEEEFNKI